MPEYCCATCKREGVKLYRPYGEFFREARVQCGAHVPEAEKGWYVPLVVWGYTSSRAEAIAAWKALPE